MENPQPSTPAATSSRFDDVQEALGFLCLVGFGYFVWPPAALLVAGVVLVVTANMRAAQRRPDRVRFADRIARALAAYRGVPDRGSS